MVSSFSTCSGRCELRGECFQDFLEGFVLESFDPADALPVVAVVPEPVLLSGFDCLGAGRLIFEVDVNAFARGYEHGVVPAEAVVPVPGELLHGLAFEAVEQVFPDLLLRAHARLLGGLLGGFLGGLLGGFLLSGGLLGGFELLPEQVVLGVQLLDVLEVASVVSVELLGELVVGLLQGRLRGIVSGEESNLDVLVLMSHGGSFLPWRAWRACPGGRGPGELCACALNSFLIFTMVKVYHRTLKVSIHL